MSLQQDGILGNEYWEEIKTVSPRMKPARWGAQLLRPLFIPKPGSPLPPIRRTAYLDGLRGFAAFLVYWHHHNLWAHDSNGQSKILESAFGYEGQNYFSCMHGIRIFFTGGHFAVGVFYVISGYVLSAKPLALIHSGEFVKLGDNLSSALFRRWLRLYIPLICTTLIFVFIWHAFGFWAAPLKSEPTLKDELWKWYVEFKNFSFVFRTGGKPWFTYNPHLWSIPVEFQGSIVVYTSLLALSRCTRNARLWCQLGLIFYFMYIADGSFCALFLSGMLLSDLDLLVSGDELPNFFWRLEKHKDIIFGSLFFASIYLGGVPSISREIEVLRNSKGWYYLSFLKPQAVFDFKWFYLFWAAVFMVSSVPRIPWLKGFFETRFCQFLGRISFSLYLVHGPILWTLADRIYAAVGWVTEEHRTTIPQWVDKFPLPKSGPMGLEPAFLLPHIILLPITFWLAEIVTRAIDEPSIRFTTWLYRRTLAGPIKS
jgi:peptidoglycan/LPS O-acetylase OafA/YrhL